MSQARSLTPSEVIYPDGDGQPMANNTKQFRPIVVIQQNLEWLFWSQQSPITMCGRGDRTLDSLFQCNFRWLKPQC